MTLPDVCWFLWSLNLKNQFGTWATALPRPSWNCHCNVVLLAARTSCQIPLASFANSPDGSFSVFYDKFINDLMIFI